MSGNFGDDFADRIYAANKARQEAVRGPSPDEVLKAEKQAEEERRRRALHKAWCSRRDVLAGIAASLAVAAHTQNVTPNVTLHVPAHKEMLPMKLTGWRARSRPKEKVVANPYTVIGWKIAVTEGTWGRPVPADRYYEASTVSEPATYERMLSKAGDIYAYGYKGFDPDKAGLDAPTVVNDNEFVPTGSESVARNALFPDEEVNLRYFLTGHPNDVAAQSKHQEAVMDELARFAAHKGLTL